MNMETGYELNVPVGGDNKDVKAIISNNEVIWERAIPTPKSGIAPLSFRATRAKPLLDWSITGKTYQAWTPSPEPQIGNNKLDNSKIEKSATVTNFAYTDSSVSFGSMTVGSVINSAEIKAEDTSYAFSFTGDTNKVTFALRCYDSSHTYLGDANKLFDEASRAVMTTLANTVYVRLYITSTVQGNISLTNLMLNKGNTVMTFEPFGYLPNAGICPVQGVGDKTGNLFERTMKETNISTTGVVATGESVKDFDLFIAKVKRNTEYTFSEKEGRTHVIGFFKDAVTMGSITYNQSRIVTAGERVYSFTTPDADINYVAIRLGSNSSNIMLNEGSTALPYEPYGYKMTEVTRGKNLFDISQITGGGKPDSTESIGTSYGYVSNEKYYSNYGVYGTGTILKGVYFNLKSGDRITISTDVLISENDLNDNENIYIGIRKFDGSKSQQTSAGIAYHGKKIRLTKTLVVDDSGKYALSLSAAGTSTQFTNLNTEFSKIQLELGSTATEYEPYIEPKTSEIYLNSPLMADEVIDSDGKREVEWRELVLTGDEQYISVIGNAPFAIYPEGFKRPTNLNITTWFCSHYQSVPNSASWATYNNLISWSTTYPDYLVMRDIRFSDITSFKDFIKSEYDKGTPVTIYYQLAEPTSETVDVPQIPTLKGNNVIDINTEVQPSNVSITYLSSGFEPQPLKTADGQILYTNNNQPLNTLE